MMTKAQMLLKEVIFVHHPEVAGEARLQKFLYERSEWVNVERMIEETMALVGGYDFVDNDYEDFADGTDSKTASVGPTPKKGQCYRVGISGIGRGGKEGTVKKGALRVVLYNPISQSLSYYFIPKAEWLQILSYHPSTGSAKIASTWNAATDCCPRLDRFKVETFEDLARHPACEATRAEPVETEVIIRRFA